MRIRNNRDYGRCNQKYYSQIDHGRTFNRLDGPWGKTDFFQLINCWHLIDRYVDESTYSLNLYKLLRTYLTER
jgi:hypothetical protein